ncbi:MAG: aldehyde dehydrogenase iron-sulfur subunit [Massilia sp.]|nr:aldehyde dehydrogenase iron-sulfur subunit [Massilia sp.]
MDDFSDLKISRRELLIAGALSVSAVAPPGVGAATLGAKDGARAEKALPPFTAKVALTVNGEAHQLELDTRTTLLDALREHLHLTGTKKGCDHGQCGACTVIVDGRRINACLSLAVMHDGQAITTIEGLALGEQLHPMQAAFLKHAGYQCGYCTPGQICSSVGMLAEVRLGMPSHVTRDLNNPGAALAPLSDEEIRERMSGNICRCSAYPNIVAAIRDVSGARS